ncbi:hypothetical protein SDC9_196132 [bioreactor metagenome]|uniref:Uncharacterized protein n=1 Tax=bioreactor metagenome TaxID=1076179 RepID=A0A645IJN5_9ZZZZ
MNREPRLAGKAEWMVERSVLPRSGLRKEGTNLKMGMISASVSKIRLPGWVNRCRRLPFSAGVRTSALVLTCGKAMVQIKEERNLLTEGTSDTTSMTLTRVPYPTRPARRLTLLICSALTLPSFLLRVEPIRNPLTEAISALMGIMPHTPTK